MKYIIVKQKDLYMIMYKKAWYTRWKYVRDKKNPTLISTWRNKRIAQSYINFKKRYETNK